MSKTSVFFTTLDATKKIVISSAHVIIFVNFLFKATKLKVENNRGIAVVNDARDTTENFRYKND